MKRQFVELQDNGLYTGPANETMAREYGKTPNGNNVGGKWVLRDMNGTFIDSDQYRHDLAERNDIELVNKE
jgi:hypothetical protein